MHIPNGALASAKVCTGNLCTRAQLGVSHNGCYLLVKKEIYIIMVISLLIQARLKPVWFSYAQSQDLYSSGSLTSKLLRCCQRSLYIPSNPIVMRHQEAWFSNVVPLAVRHTWVISSEPMQMSLPGCEIRKLEAVVAKNLSRLLWKKFFLFFFPNPWSYSWNLFLLHSYYVDEIYLSFIRNLKNNFHPQNLKQDFIRSLLRSSPIIFKKIGSI